jgi:hypothetical protein
VTADWVVPRYGTGSIADVVPSVCDGLAVPGAWNLLQLPESARVVILVIDGLGHHQLHEHCNLAATLIAAQRGVITSVTPTTTPVALTSIGTGAAPGGHGIVGASFRLPDTGELLWPLGWRGHPSPRDIQPDPTWWERTARAGVEVAIVSPRAYAEGGLTGAALRGGAYVGADGPGERVAEIAAAIRRGQRSLVYAYWEFLDRAAHVHGVGSAHYRAELEAADSFVAQVADALPSGAVLIVTADHGLVDCEDVVDLDLMVDLWPDVSVAAGEPRFRHVYTRPGAAAAVAGAWQETLADAAVVLTREDAIARGWFGAVEPDVRDRIGDVLAVATQRVRLALPSQDPAVSALIGQHGSLSPAEMDVPLVVIEA